jgi:hypothetical protein
VDRGDADTIILRWAGSGGSNVDLTGHNLELFDIATELTDKIVAEWADPTTGRARFRLTSIKDLPTRRRFGFRCAIIEPGGDRAKDRAFPKINVVAV